VRGERGADGGRATEAGPRQRGRLTDALVGDEVEQRGEAAVLAVDERSAAGLAVVGASGRGAEGCQGGATGAGGLSERLPDRRARHAAFFGAAHEERTPCLEGHAATVGCLVGRRLLCRGVCYQQRGLERRGENERRGQKKPG